jgi:hypothetical protein
VVEGYFCETRKTRRLYCKKARGCSVDRYRLGADWIRPVGSRSDGRAGMHVCERRRPSRSRRRARRRNPQPGWGARFGARETPGRSGGRGALNRGTGTSSQATTTADNATGPQRRELRRACAGDAGHELEFQKHHGPPHLLAVLPGVSLVTDRQRTTRLPAAARLGLGVAAAQARAARVGAKAARQGGGGGLYRPREGTLGVRARRTCAHDIDAGASPTPAREQRGGGDDGRAPPVSHCGGSARGWAAARGGRRSGRQRGNQGARPDLGCWAAQETGSRSKGSSFLF